MDSLFFAFLESRSSHSFVVGSSIRKKKLLLWGHLVLLGSM